MPKLSPTDWKTQITVFQLFGCQVSVVRANDFLDTDYTDYTVKKWQPIPDAS